jgi:hypothetical protein
MNAMEEVNASKIYPIMYEYKQQFYVACCKNSNSLCALRINCLLLLMQSGRFMTAVPLYLAQLQGAPADLHC